MDDRFSKGMTKNLTRRLQEQNQGRHKSASPYVPWELVYSEEFKSMADGRNRELYFKIGSGREFLRSIIT